MARSAVWYTGLDAANRSVEKMLVGSLAQCGIDPVRLGDPCPATPGLVFFARPTGEVGELIRETSRCGLVRVLAVGLPGAAVPCNETWRLLGCGAADVLGWDRSPDPAAEVVARLQRWAEVDRLVASPLVRNNLVGSSPTWIAALRQVVEVASYTDSPVLITGESGTGKELIARLIHSLDRRERKRDLVVLDCTTIVPELSGSEFFGHERGAYTGATAPRDGAIALADRGTLFLDEIGELALPLQAQLLRAVQERTYKRVGGNRWNSAQFRLVCATNRELLDDVGQGRFRADLYFRIASVVCRVPPLRDRPGDIIPLFRHFFSEHRPGTDTIELDETVREFLVQREYPGNVRDLKQLAARIAYRHVGPGPITAGDLPENERPAVSVEEENWRDLAFDTAIRRALAQGVGLKEIGKVAADAAIRIALDEEQGNLQRAAQMLGVTDRALQMRKAASRQGESADDRGQPN